MYEEILNEIFALKNAQNMIIQPPSSNSALNRMREDAVNRLGQDVPSGYLQFLTKTNGLNWNGLFIYSTDPVSSSQGKMPIIQGFVDANLLWREHRKNEKYLIFGDSDLDKYAMLINTSEYQILDRVSFDVVDTCGSFDELIKEALTRNI